MEVLKATRAGDPKMRMARNVVMAQLENLGPVMEIEKASMENRENKMWKLMGAWKLEGFDDSVFLEGDRMLLKLENKNKIKLFRNRGIRPMVTLHRVVLNEETREWEEDMDNPLTKELKGHIVRIDKAEDSCFFSLEHPFINPVTENVKENQFFMFQSQKPLFGVNYWRKGEYDNNEALLHVIGGGEPHLGLLNRIEDHMSKAIEIKSMKDRAAPGGGLNATQMQALRMARNEERKLVCIQGPPGTGKTHVLAHFLSHHVMDGKCAFVLAPTLEGLSNIKTKMEEVMKAMKILEQLHDYAIMDINKFQDILNSSEEVKAAEDLTADWKKEVQEGVLSREDYNCFRLQAAESAKKKATKNIVSHVKIVFSTVSSCFINIMLRSKFRPKVCVIDEAGQVTEGATWPACDKMQRVVLAGDPMQLPAVIFSKEGREQQLGRSVMDRVMENKDRFSWIMLNTHYRCHELICSWSNRHFYDNKLVAAPYVKRGLDKFFTVHTGANFGRLKNRLAEKVYEPFVMFDTSFIQDETLRVATYEKALFATDDEFSEVTYCNQAEAEIVIDHFNSLVQNRIKPSQIAVITPYRGQYELIRKLVKNRNLEIENIGTVDRFQGREFDIVIFSMVRNNPQRQLGFVSDLRRLNVAITRAKHHFALVGSGYMLYENKEDGKKKQLMDLITWFQRTGHRFPPKFARGEITTDYNCKATPQNNFGHHFEAFKNFTEDPKMLQHIRNHEVRMGLIKPEDL